MARQWFDVDKEGLAKLKEGSDGLILELIQNALDTNATKVSVTLEPEPGRAVARLVVEDDDPDGFTDLTHAYRLFAESEKKGDPTKRGRFNLGEKLVLSRCIEATISSTKGAVRFNSDGTRSTLRQRLESGSVFDALIRMTREQVKVAIENAHKVIASIPVTINGVEVPFREPIASFNATLPTEIAGEDGVLRRTTRKTQVSVYEAMEGPAQLYELGIPVVETGDKFDINIEQKIPLNMDRDNVHPSYLRKIRVEVLNNLHQMIDQEDANSTWVQDASSSKDIEKDAFKTVIRERFGRGAVSYDPSDREANARATVEGKTVIAGRSLSSEQWANARRFESITPAGRSSFATPKPYSDDPNAEPVKLLDPSKWDEGMLWVEVMARSISKQCHGRECDVRITYGKRNHSACYGGGTLDLNLNVLGRKWFAGRLASIVDLIIHELAHEVAESHLSDAFHSECTRIAGIVAEMVVENPSRFTR